MNSNTLAKTGSQSEETAETQNFEEAVLARYGEGAREAQPELCCPIDYEARYLKVLPQEIIDKDYGCGNPSAYVHAGERVLDLGSGGGKICYILSQKVGAEGRVTGVDFNDEMLALARKYQRPISDELGYDNVSFQKGKIQDLALDLDAAQAWLRTHPVHTVEQIQDYGAECDRLRREEPLIADSSIDVVVSNCVLNLVRPQDKQHLFSEIYRVLAKGGRAVISDIVCDEDPSQTLINDPELWSGCISGAFREDRFLEMFEEAGFHGVEIVERQSEPWRVVDGIEFRSMTVRAHAGNDGPCMEHNEAVVYGGPWKAVLDDDGHTFHRGQRMAVCNKTFTLMTDPNGPYADSILGLTPRVPVSADDATPWNANRDALRHPRESKGTDYHLTTEGDDAPCCGPSGCC